MVKKAVQLFFSTNLFPDYDLSTCHVRELPNTNRLALVMPLPDTSHFQMPPPFGQQHNPGHCVMERQSTLLSKYSWKERSDLQTGLITKTLSVVTYQPLGHSFLAEKYPTVTEQSHLGQNENSLTPSARKARASRTSS